jgi:hypothetical protein
VASDVEAEEVGVAAADVGADEMALFTCEWMRLTARESSRRALRSVVVLVFMIFSRLIMCCCSIKVVEFSFLYFVEY